MTSYRKTMRQAMEEMLQSLNESNLEKMRKASKGAKQTLKMKDGSIGMDSFTASAIMQIYDKVNDKNKKTMENLLKGGKKADIVKLMKFAMSKVNAEYVPEEVELDEGKMSAAQIDKLKKVYEPMRDKKISTANANKLSAMMDKFGKDKDVLIQLFKADIPFVSQSAVTKLITKYNMKGAELNKLREEVELDEAPNYSKGSVMVDLENDDPKLMKDIKKMGIKVKDLGDSGNSGYNEYKLTGSPAALKKGGKKFGWDQQVEKVQVKEGKMSQMHQLIKDKKSAEEISKIMRLDLKSVKALMANYMSAGYHESYEIGTDKYRKHTEDVTPGEDGDWVTAQKGKNDSMRETLAKVWGFTEDKNPFKKESKKDLTKEVKDGKTMTGKKVASVEMNPKIMEKKK